MHSFQYHGAHTEDLSDASQVKDIVDVPNEENSEDFLQAARDLAMMKDAITSQPTLSKPQPDSRPEAKGQQITTSFEESSESSLLALLAAAEIVAHNSKPLGANATHSVVNSFAAEAMSPPHLISENTAAEIVAHLARPHSTNDAHSAVNPFAAGDAPSLPPHLISENTATENVTHLAQPHSTNDAHSAVNLFAAEAVSSLSSHLIPENFFRDHWKKIVLGILLAFCITAATVASCGGTAALAAVGAAMISSSVSTATAISFGCFILTIGCLIGGTLLGVGAALLEKCFCFKSPRTVKISNPKTPFPQSTRVVKNSTADIMHTVGNSNNGPFDIKGEQFNVAPIANRTNSFLHPHVSNTPVGLGVSPHTNSTATGFHP